MKDGLQKTGTHIKLNCIPTKASQMAITGKTISVRGWHQRRDSFTWEMQCCLVRASHWCALCPDRPWELQKWAHSQALPTNPSEDCPASKIVWSWGMVEPGTHQCCSMCPDAPAASPNGRRKQQQLCRNTTTSLSYWVHSRFPSMKIQARKRHQLLLHIPLPPPPTYSIKLLKNTHSPKGSSCKPFNSCPAAWVEKSLEVSCLPQIYPASRWHQGTRRQSGTGPRGAVRDLGALQVRRGKSWGFSSNSSPAKPHWQ